MENTKKSTVDLDALAKEEKAALIGKSIKKEAKKLDKNVLLEVIQKEADIYQRKLELFEQVKKINGELKHLSENHPVGSYGFAVPGDAMSKGKFGGFKDNINISHIAELEQEMAGDGSALNEVEKLKQENDVLRKELDELRSASAKSIEEKKSMVHVKEF